MNALVALHELSLGLSNPNQDLDDEEKEDLKTRRERREARELFNASSMVDKGEVEGCLSTLVMALGCLMSGSCHKETIQLLIKLQRRLHPKLCHRTEVGIGMGFGTRMAINMALGFVSLGSGRLSLRAESKEAVACLLISLYPTLPSSSTDNRYHLQALRHFYVLAARERRLSSMDVDTGRQVTTKAVIISKDEATNQNGSLRVSMPCLIPPAPSYRSEGGSWIKVDEEGYLGLEVAMDRGRFGSSALQITVKKLNEEYLADLNEDREEINQICGSFSLS